MKSYATTLVLGGLLVLCLLYLYVVEWPQAQRKAQEEKQAKQLISFQSDDVREMILEYRDKDRIVLSKNADREWQLVQPLQYRADDAEAEDVIRDLVVATVTRVIRDPESNLGDYGLAPPKLTLSFKLENGTERFFIGEKGPVSSQLYFKRGGEPDVYLTNLPDRDILSKTPVVLRRKELFDVHRDTIDRIALEWNSKKFSLFKAQQTWFLEEPLQAFADQSVIGMLLFQIENLRAVDFVDGLEKQEKMLEQFSGTHHVIHFQVQGDPYSMTFFPGVARTGFVYVLTSEDSPGFIVPRANFESIPSNLFQLRDKYLTRVDRSRVTELEILTSGAKVKLPLESAGDPLPHSVREFMRRVLDVKAEIFVRETGVAEDFSTRDFDVPALEVKLLGQSKNVLGYLTVSEIISSGDDDKVGSAYAKGSSLPGVYGIRSSILINIPTKQSVRSEIVP